MRRILFTYALVSMVCDGIFVAIILWQHFDINTIPLWFQIIAILCIPGICVELVQSVKRLKH